LRFFLSFNELPTDIEIFDNKWVAFVIDAQVEYGDEQYLIELKRNYDSYTREEGLDQIPCICHVLVFLKDI
jgi:hypothetical protein